MTALKSKSEKNFKCVIQLYWKQLKSKVIKYFHYGSLDTPPEGYKTPKMLSYKVFNFLIVC